MRGVLIKWLINSLAILIVTYIVRGIEVVSPITAIVAAFLYRHHQCILTAIYNINHVAYKYIYTGSIYLLH